ncbi:hypothetical protein [Nonomuraea phyllanthi]|uniref:hypothetical protein n=1 Tax=Nonomuraea phyllanthi TaxID=2219224 RepID=UPI001884FB4D|nr:hypothetical protein [Nonomuraea phyllanthi]
MTLAPPANAFARLPASHRRGRGGLPAVIVGVGAVVVFLWCGVSARDLAAFTAYIGIEVALPGTLLWRALAGGGRSRAEDVAAGLAFGYALEVLAYLPARALGAPLLVLVMPAGVLGAFAFVPGLRRHWRGGPAAVRSAGGHAIGGAVAERMPAWCAWALAAVVAYLIAWSALHLYRVPISRSYVDMPYHLALVGEVRHNVPPTLPSVLGEPLSYHWFVHAEMAATSWVTGIEPVTLVYRLSTLPMMAAMVVLVAVVGRQLGGRWGAGVAAVGVTYFLLSPALREGADFTSRSMFTAWASPTQTFGALLFAPVVLLLTRGRLGRGWLGRGWVALVVLLVALTGAKATFLPLLLAGAVVVVAVRWVVERGLRADWLCVAGVALVCLVIAQVVVFGRGSQGTVVAPFAAMRVLWGAVAGVGEPGLAAVPVAPLAVLTCVHLFCLACVWGGVAGLGRRVLEPSMSLLLGMGAAGVGAAVLLGHPASSQLYFLESVRPYLSVAAVCGVAGRRVPWRSPTAMAGAGAMIALLAARVEVPGGVLARVVTPYALLGASAVAVLLLWRRAGRTTRAAPVRWRRAGGTTRAGPVRWGRAGGVVRAGPVVSRRGRAGVAVVAMVAMVAGFAVPASVREAALRVAPEHGGRLVEIPPGAVRAARWLRGHSAPGDVVATDLHCRPVQVPGCDSRHYWVAGLTERRVLVEGWAYAESTLSRAELFVSPYLRVPFADQARLAANDATFRAPSARNVQHLAQKYGVKWLFTGINPELGKFARLQFRNSHFSVYRIG